MSGIVRIPVPVLLPTEHRQKRLILRRVSLLFSHSLSLGVLHFESVTLNANLPPPQFFQSHFIHCSIKGQWTSLFFDTEVVVKAIILFLIESSEST